MNKQEFIGELIARLEGIPENEKQKSVEYYSEMIDDRIEDGMSEAEAVAAVGTIDDAVNEILENVPLTSIIKTKAATRRKRKPLEIVLLCIGSPIWVPLLLVFIILILVMYLVIWVVVIVFFVADLAIFLSGIAAAIIGFFGFGKIGIAYPLAAIGAGLVLIGLSVLLLIPLIKLAKVTAKLAKVIARWIKSWFVGGKKNA